jgi:nitrite reductase/ring-hydroxylating ferredoxin subunit
MAENDTATGSPESATEDAERRATLGWIGASLLGGSLLAAYGTLAGFMGRFLFPSGPPAMGWMYVTRLADLAPGGALLYRTPAGRTVNIARQGDGEDSLIALSSTCPHLGCQVHWQPQNDRFFCPCHNGIFTPDGTAIGGPPGEAGQSLPRYPLKVENDLLYIEVPTEELAMGTGRVLDPDAAPAGPPGPGHDPCLYPACPVDLSTAEPARRA